MIWRNQHGSYGVTSGRGRVEADERLKMRGKIPRRSKKVPKKGKILKILPVLLLNEEIYIYDNNFFYENWLEKKEDKKTENIEYLFPIENLETIETIKKNQNNLEKINLDNIFDKDHEKDNLFVIIDYNKQKIKFFLKGTISSKKIVRNLSLDNNVTEKIEYQDILIFLKKEILELVKSQNVIDIGAPSFLNINFSQDLY